VCTGALSIHGNHPEMCAFDVAFSCIHYQTVNQKMVEMLKEILQTKRYYHNEGNLEVITIYEKLYSTSLHVD